MSKNVRNEAPELAEIRRELNQVAQPSDVDKLINLINVYKDYAVDAARMRTMPPIISAHKSDFDNERAERQVRITYSERLY